jgi:putative phage-type endonuclease
MDKSLQLIKTVGMSRMDWLSYRKTGIGASEVGTIMGLNPYKASVRLFYEKVGMLEPSKVETMSMFIGKETEATIADWWQYWDGTEEGFISNFYAGHKLRRCSRVNAYVRNPKYPWLFVSLDRRIHKQGTSPEGALECKNMGENAARMWESGVPPEYVLQLQTQLLVCMFQHGELASLTGGRQFAVYPFEPVKSLHEAIVDKTRTFWLNVEQGRRLYGQIVHNRATMNFRAVDELTAQLDELEPPPDGSDAYTRYLSEKYKGQTVAGERPGTDAELATAVRALGMKEEVKKYTEKAASMENLLKKGMGIHTKLSFGAHGYVTFAPDTNGVRRFVNRVKTSRE